jgi:transposase
LIHVAGFNLGILMRALFGRGTPKEAADVKNALVFVVPSDVALTLAILAVIDGALSMLVIIIAPETH